MTQSLKSFYHAVRQQTMALTEGLSVEDMVPQSMPDASPVKWHLAHTTWFFETFILKRHCSGYRSFNVDYQYLFNSYYDAVGSRHARPQRGMLTRPSVGEIQAYRQHIDEHMYSFMDEQDAVVSPLVIIGLHHEMQHQELILTDLLHLLSCNPLLPAVQSSEVSAATGPTHPQPIAAAKIRPKMIMHPYEGGLLEIGALDSDFSYDCENPRHSHYLAPFKLASRPVINGEWVEFIEDGGYDNPLLWLSDGWFQCQENQWRAPLYWQRQDGHWSQFGLSGLQPINPAAPVSHISYYEADAFARWAGKRLPREQEWEVVARASRANDNKQQDNLLESHIWRPTSCTANGGIEKLFGDVWEWTQSPYAPYPGFQPAQGELAEYNGKFMANQFVLRGGSCVSPAKQLRDSYRNFFYPHQRWQFSGLRLAEDQ